MSDSIDETADTPTVLLAAVTLSMRQQVHLLLRWPQLSRTAARLLCVLGGLHQRSGVALSTLAGTIIIAVQTFIAVQIFLFHAKTKIGRIRADFYCRTDFLFYTITKISRTHDPRADVYCRTDGTDFFSGVYELETRFARIINYNPLLTSYAAIGISAKKQKTVIMLVHVAA